MYICKLETVSAPRKSELSGAAARTGVLIKKENGIIEKED